MMTLEELMAEWKVDAHIDRDRIAEAAIRTANLHQKYLDLLTKYKLKLFKLEKEFMDMKGKMYRYYSGHCTKEDLVELNLPQYQYKHTTKAELERLLETDARLVDINQKIFYYKALFEYCEEVLREIRNRNYEIKNYIDWMKFQSGT